MFVIGNVIVIIICLFGASELWIAVKYKLKITYLHVSAQFILLHVEPQGSSRTPF